MDFYNRYKGPIIGATAIIILCILTFANIGSAFTLNSALVFPLLVVVILGSFYFISRDFFKKYSILIVLMSTFILLYFIYLLAYDTPKHDLVFNVIALPIPILILLWLFERWKWVKTLESEKEKTELSLLKSQVNPHFFFNTLNNIHALVVKKSDSAPNVILKLSEMMRYTIYEGKKERVPLHQEVEYLNNYIDLHKIRYHRSVDIRFSSNISQNHEVAPLLFITLLENAFKHGVESVPDSAFIDMQLNSESDHISFAIANNFHKNDQDDTKGIGLENLKHRLNLIYPGSHKILISKENNLFKVMLKIYVK